MNDVSINKILEAFATSGITFIAAGEASQDGGEGFRLTPISRD